MNTKKKTARSARKGKKAPRTVQLFERQFPVQKDGSVLIGADLLTRPQFEALKDDALLRAHQLKGGGTEGERQNRAFAGALDHLRFQHRPTSTAPGWIGAVVDDLTGIQHALMGLKEFPFYRQNTGRRGIEAINGLRGDLNRIVDCLAMFHTAMRAEARGELPLHKMVEQRKMFESLRNSAGDES